MEEPALLYSFSLFVRLAYIMVFPKVWLPIDSDAVDYDFLARNVSTGIGFGYGVGNLSSFRPPLHPLFLGAVYFLFGRSHLVAQCVQAVVGALLPVTVFAIGKRVFDVRNARLSAFITAIYPPFLSYSASLMTENLFTILVAAFTLSVLILRERTNSILAWIVSGVLVGLAVLTRSNILPFMAVSLALLYAFAEPEIRRTIFAKAFLLIACAGLIISPWTLRNYRVHHAFVPLSTNSGHIFWLSFNPLTEKEFRSEDLRAYIASLRYQNITSEEAYDRISGQMQFGLEFLNAIIRKRYPTEPLPATEMEADRLFRTKAKETIAANPSIFPRKMIKDALRFWHIYDHWGRYMFSFAIILPFSAVGILLSVRQWRQSLILYMLLATLLLTEVIFHATARFRVPFEPYFIIFASVALLRVKDKFGQWSAAGIGGVAVGLNSLAFLHADNLRRALRAFAQLLGFEVMPW